jgi:hypothetical protein
VTATCVPACRRDTECVERYGDPNFTCRNNACVRAETCYSDANCPSTKWCYKEPGRTDSDPGICQAACNADAECPLSQRCLPIPPSNRRRCVDGCQVDENTGCPLNAICVSDPVNGGGKCESADSAGRGRCQVKEVCAFKESCVNKSCIPQPDHCKSCAAGCGAGGCGTMYANIKQASCSLLSCNCNGVTCPDGARPVVDQLAGICACPIQRCVYRCTTDAQCPKGFLCTQVPVNGNNGPWCFPQGDAKDCR